MRYYLILLFASGLHQTVFGQLKRDSILLYERTMDRPLTLHQGQLRVNGNFELSIFNKRFNNNGDVVKLSDEGITKVRQALVLDVKYGFNDFVQVNLQVASRSESQRGNEYDVITSTESISIHNETVTKGLDDILLTADLRAPLKTKKIDLVVTAGSTFPTAKNQPDQPEHSIQYLKYDNSTSGYTRLIYHNNNHWGNGVPIVVIGLRGKARAKKWAYSGSIEYHRPTSQSQGKSWKYQVYGSAFQYYPIDYTYQVPDQLMTSVEAEHQVLPWIDTFLGFDFTNRNGGWTTQTEQKVALGNAKLFGLHGGLEILITHRLWMRQLITYSLSGTNTFAPFTIYTTLNYNLFLK